jgi:uncharacterized protein with HEPN domain
LRKDDLIYVGHMHVDLDIVWDVVTRDLDPLVAQLKPLLPAE